MKNHYVKAERHQKPIRTSVLIFVVVVTILLTIGLITAPKPTPKSESKAEETPVAVMPQESRDPVQVQESLWSFSIAPTSTEPPKVDPEAVRKSWEDHVRKSSNQ